MSWLVLLAPIVVATVGGLLAGGALADPDIDHPSDGGWHTLALVAVGGLVGGFVVLVYPFSAVEPGSVGPLSPTGIILLSELVVPVAAGLLATLSSSRVPGRRAHVLAGIGVTATAVGATLAYGFVTSRFGDDATRYLANIAPELIVDGLAAVTVLVLAVIAGTALSPPNPDW